MTSPDARDDSRFPLVPPPALDLVDSHCHLDWSWFDGRVREVLDQARAHGVGAFLTICTRMDAFSRIHALTALDPALFCSVGVHPDEAASHATLTPGELLGPAALDRVVAIGECGLDYHNARAPAGLQKEVFRAHIQAALAADLPLVVHSRDADGDTLELLEEGGGRLRGVIHCFTGGEELARGALGLGLSLSFSGIITFRKTDQLRRIAAMVPEERLLVETDAPFLSPEPLRGRKNEPARTLYTAHRLAQERNISLDRLAQLTSDNFFRLFSRATPPPGFRTGSPDRETG